jgi:hypothetical protein
VGNGSRDRGEGAGGDAWGVGGNALYGICRSHTEEEEEEDLNRNMYN